MRQNSDSEPQTDSTAVLAARTVARECAQWPVVADTRNRADNPGNLRGPVGSLLNQAEAANQAANRFAKTRAALHLRSRHNSA